MIFSSSLFLLAFLPLFLCLYYFVDRRFKNNLLLAVSLFFYSWGAPQFVFILLVSTIADFHIVKRLHRSTSDKIRKYYLIGSITLNLGMLAYFKYANFFVDNVNAVLNNFGFHELTWIAIALPIGISFYTFQTLTYSIDIYRKKYAPLHKVTDYLMYIFLFPQMIAGPIVQYNMIAHQIENRSERIDDILSGFYRFCIGLAKKALIANMIAKQVSISFAMDFDVISQQEAWIGLLAFTFQIYFDFSGYSDMAIGLGRMIGFKFPENFNSPYVSQSITEFWQRWHITLGSFMKNYVYIPLGGNRVENKSRLYFNLGLVFLLSGLWHGASWNFIIWGAFHGFFLITERAFLKKFLGKIGKTPATMFTFFIVSIGWVFFKIDDFDQAILFLKALFTFTSTSTTVALPYFYFVLSISILFSFLSLFEIGKRIQSYFFEKNSYTTIEHFGLTILSISLFVASVTSITVLGFNPFIYFKF